MDLTLIITVAVSAVVAAALTGIVLRYASARLVDVPGARSSHVDPTPTGGGVGVVVVLLFVMLWLALQQRLDADFVYPAIVGLALVASVGWADDHRQVPPLWRVLMQFLSATMVVWALGGMQVFAVGESIWRLGIIGSALSVIGVVWFVNLFNFMDGIDGLAALEAVFVSGVMAAVFWIQGESGAALLAGALAGGCLGFLVWNWPPARVFMGDVGSYGIGFALAMLALYGESSGSLPLAVSGILAAVFFLDATFTLLARLLRRARWYTAHREHAYQAPVAAGTTHRRVIVVVSFVNVVLLLPVALGVLVGLVNPLWAVVGVAAAGWVVWFLVRRRYR